MTNFKRLQTMTIDELAEWLDKHGQFDLSPWLTWWDKNYCSNCESIKCKYVDAKEKLGFSVSSYYDREIECAYCELADESGVKKCRFFPELNDVPSNLDIIKLWLNKEADK